MKGYLTLLLIDIKLSFRNGLVLFFNYLFPVIFFFAFAEVMIDADEAGAISYIVSMVLVLGIVGNGLFGGGVRVVQEREMNILRRFKVAPISPIPILVSSMITGWVIYIPAAFLILGLAHYIYGMPFPERLLSLLLLVSMGIFAFRALGLILGSVANSVQENNMLVQLLYMPMLFLSGATFPLTSLPDWAQSIAQFLPASYLITGFQGIFFRNETFVQNWPSGLALVVTVLLSTFISVQLFRWDKEEKIKPAAKLWALAAVSPFIFLGAYQVYTREHMRKAEMLWRDLQRSGTILIRDARLFIGDGRIIERGRVLIRNGKIAEVSEGTLTGHESARVRVVEASGKTLLPGLIDAHVHLDAWGGVGEPTPEHMPRQSMAYALAAYLYSGVAAVRDAGGGLADLLKLQSQIARGEHLGAEPFAYGLAADGSCWAGYSRRRPAPIWVDPGRQRIGSLKTPEAARRQVRELKARGANGIACFLEAGETGISVDQDASLIRALAEEARALGLPVIVYARHSNDIPQTLQAPVDGIEYGSLSGSIPDSLLATMVSLGVAYSPILSALEASARLAAGEDNLLNRPLVQQVGPGWLIDGTRKLIRTGRASELLLEDGEFRTALEHGKENLLRAYRAGAMLVAGSDAGKPLVLHGPAIHRELQLWVEAGIPPKAALQAATYNAAKLLRADQRIGLVKEGYDANLILVDGNPLEDIAAIERIATVIYRGELVERSKLLKRPQ